jgi:hypothetical protein
MSTERHYWPADYADEVMPAPEVSPSAWIRRCDGDKWIVEEAEVEKEASGLWHIEVAAGDIVDFISCVRLGSVEVRIDGEKQWTVLDRVPEAVVPGGHLVFSWGVEFISADIDELMGAFFEDGVSWKAGEVMLIDVADWSEKEQWRLVVEVGEDEAQHGAFERVATVEGSGTA